MCICTLGSASVQCHMRALDNTVRLAPSRRRELPKEFFMSASLILWEYGDNAKASKAEVHTVDLNVGNIVAQTGLFDDWRAAVTAVSLGNPGSYALSAIDATVGKVTATDTAAQRENKWLVSYTDNVTGLPGSYTIPCFDNDQLAVDGESMAAGANRTALISATEAFVRSNAKNAVTVTSIKFRAYSI